LSSATAAGRVTLADPRPLGGAADLRIAAASGGLIVIVAIVIATATGRGPA
jgi:hypothetical protein